MEWNGPNCSISGCSILLRLCYRPKCIPLKLSRRHRKMPSWSTISQQSLQSYLSNLVFWGLNKNEPRNRFQNHFSFKKGSLYSLNTHWVLIKYLITFSTVSWGAGFYTQDLWNTFLLEGDSSSLMLMAWWLWRQMDSHCDQRHSFFPLTFQLYNT